MAKQNTPPAINETAFICPHCSAFTTQHWFTIQATVLNKEEKTPFIPTFDFLEEIAADKNIPEDKKSSLSKYIGKLVIGQLFIENNPSGKYVYNDVGNLFLSLCYNCNKVAVWVHDKLVYPSERQGAQPNPDLPEDIIIDYEEARSILQLSPRGAAALLRLSIQKLCLHLGEKGKNIDDDIASLVSKGLSPVIQKALDVVRVIGNEAVHPGTIDLRDDMDAANRLFDIVNVIAEQMISHPKHINSMYDKLPDNKKEAIESRNQKAIKNLKV